MRDFRGRKIPPGYRIYHFLLIIMFIAFPFVLVLVLQDGYDPILLGMWACFSGLFSTFAYVRGTKQALKLLKLEKEYFRFLFPLSVILMSIFLAVNAAISTSTVEKIQFIHRLAAQTLGYSVLAGVICLILIVSWDTLVLIFHGKASPESKATQLIFVTSFFFFFITMLILALFFLVGEMIAVS